MKRIAVVAILAVALAFCGTAFAFENEPEGFRGLKWGDRPKTDMTALKILPKFNRIEYVRADEKLVLGEAQLDRIVYWFHVSGYWERFMAVFLKFSGKENYKLLKTICKQKFGEPSNEGYDYLDWLSAKTIVNLKYDMVDGNGMLMLSDALLTVLFTEEQERAQTEAAEDDW